MRPRRGSSPWGRADVPPGAGRLLLSLRKYLQKSGAEGGRRWLADVKHTRGCQGLIHPLREPVCEEKEDSPQFPQMPVGRRQQK
jgi:hypothetical protein